MDNAYTSITVNLAGLGMSALPSHQRAVSDAMPVWSGQRRVTIDVPNGAP